VTIVFILIRIGLFCFGLGLFATGMVEFADPDMLHSEELTRKPRHLEMMFGAGFLGYGGLLLVGSRLLYRNYWLCSVLVILTVSLIVTSFLNGTLHAARLVQLLVFYSPAALAMLLVVREARRANAPVQNDDAPPYV